MVVWRNVCHLQIRWFAYFRRIENWFWNGFTYENLTRMMIATNRNSKNTYGEQTNGQLYIYLRFFWLFSICEVRGVSAVRIDLFSSHTSNNKRLTPHLCATMVTFGFFSRKLYTFHKYPRLVNLGQWTRKKKLIEYSNKCTSYFVSKWNICKRFGKGWNLSKNVRTMRIRVNDCVIK